MNTAIDNNGGTLLVHDNPTTVTLNHPANDVGTTYVQYGAKLKLGRMSRAANGRRVVARQRRHLGQYRHLRSERPFSDRGGARPRGHGTSELNNEITNSSPRRERSR